MLTVLAAGLTIAAPAGSHPAAAPGDATLASCDPPSAHAPTRAPTASPRLDDPAACRTGTRVLESTAPRALESDPSRPAGGYQHLGATTAGGWAGVSGRLTVRDASVRRHTYDFVASRFMMKRDVGGGEIAWLEAGWAETGWDGDGRQRIYTYDTNTRSWRFYDQYPIADGDRIWLDLHTDSDGVWQAWLWWDDRWNLLAAEQLRIGATAQAEQYVEVHVDGARPARVTVAPVAVDNVQLTPAGGAPRYWRDDVDTLVGDPGHHRRGGLCLHWTNRFDTWSAGACPQEDGQPAFA